MNKQGRYLVTITTSTLYLSLLCLQNSRYKQIIVVKQLLQFSCLILLFIMLCSIFQYSKFVYASSAITLNLTLTPCSTDHSLYKCTLNLEILRQVHTCTIKVEIKIWNKIIIIDKIFRNVNWPSTNAEIQLFNDYLKSTIPYQNQPLNCMPIIKRGFDQALRSQSFTSLMKALHLKNKHSFFRP